MDLKSEYRLRVENCIGTIVDVHDSLCTEYESLEFLSRFRDLKEVIQDLDMNLASEGDILLVEQATNALLGEFESLFETAEIRPIYERPLS